jgi:hypothetical protein
VSRFRAASAASAAVAIAVTAVAFGAGGGTQVGRTAPVEVITIALAGILLAAALVAHDFKRPLHGGFALGLLGAYAVVVGLSLSWSVTPDLTAQALSLSLAYLAVFAVALIAPRYLPGGAATVASGLLAASTAVCAWALATRIWPGSLASEVIGARLGAPFDYWNALGSMAALSVPLALWLGSRREGTKATAALVYPAVGILLLTVVLTQSRGALAAVVLGAAGWLAFAPLRLRSAPVIAVPALVVVPTAAWALSRHAFTSALQTLEERQAVAGSFGLLVGCTLLVLVAAGLAAVVVRDHRPFSLEARRRAGIAWGAVVAVLVVAALVGTAVTGGGYGGRLKSLTSDQSTVAGSGAGRLGSTSSSRGEYWRQAMDVFKSRPVTGRGADGFTLARLPYRHDPKAANHAHGFVPQTMADLGLLGLLVVIVLLVAWAVAAGRTLGVRRRGAMGPGWTDERAALTALGLAALAYGLQSAIDWTWFIPGPTVAALMAAGFLAGRGPLVVQDAPVPATERRPVLRGADPLRVLGAAALLVTAILCAWAAWQPQRSQAATDRAIELSDQGHLAAAVRQADKARKLDPHSADPLYARSTALAEGGHKVAAYRALEQAVAEHPRDPETWYRLSAFELDEFDLPLRALQSANAAYSIDPQSVRIKALAIRANTRLAATQAPAPPPKAKP